MEEILREPGILAALGLCRKDRLRSPVADRVSGDGRTRWAEIINLQGRRSARSDGERPWRRPSPDRAGRTEAVEGVCPLCERPDRKSVVGKEGVSTCMSRCGPDK